MKKDKIMNFLLCLIMIVSCNERERTLNYFDFDEVEYYSKEISENDVLAEYKKSQSGSYDKSYLKIVENEYPSKLNDIDFVTNLIKFGYKQKQIDKSEHGIINQIFSKSTCEELTATGCIPIYADILIFKNKGKVVGIAKVSFVCRTAYIIGSKENWDNFGECGNFEKLKLILEK